MGWREEAAKRMEDRFIDIAESALNKGLDFDQAFKADAEGIDYRLSPAWKEIYQDLEKRAAPFRQYHQKWSADGYRREVEARRKGEARHTQDEAFYQQNKSALFTWIEDGKDFKSTGWHESLREFYDRACKELGVDPIPDKPEPQYDPFILAFQSEN